MPNEQTKGGQQEQEPAHSPVVRVSIVEDQIQTDAANAAEQEAEAREVRDLIAQEGMRFEAKRMADDSVRQTVLTGIGAVLVFISLLLALQANRAALTAVKITRETADRQLRPYVLPTGLEVSDNGHGGINVKLKWFNHGQTPTMRAITSHYVEVAEELPSKDFIYRADIDQRATRIAIGPNSETKCIGPSISSLDVARMRSKQAHILVWGFVEYSDRAQGGKRFRTEYCARIVDGADACYQWAFVQHGPFNGWDDECLHPAQSI